MDLLTASPFGWVLLFALGIRHGFDPDHIAVIDGLSLRGAERGARWARWVGLLFSSGHGLSFTAVAVLAGVFGRQLTPTPLLARGLDVASVAVLLWLGIANVAALRRAGPYRPAGWKGGWVRGVSGGPATAMLLGVVFGAMFDTIVQAVSLGAAALHGGVGVVVLASAVFSGGMIVTDGLDGFLLARALARRGTESVARYRRIVGGLVAGLAFAVAGLELLSMAAGIDAADAALTALGAAAAAAVLAASIAVARGRRPPRPAPS